MKKLKPGKINSDKQGPIWVAVKFKCSTCGGEFELDSHDACTIISQERRPGGLVVLESPACPTKKCNATNILRFYPVSGMKYLTETWARSNGK